MRRQAIGALVSALLVCLQAFAATPASARSTVFFDGDGVCRDIALTYDAEFSATTQDLIDTIDALGIRTTWFFAGDSVDSYPEIVQQVAARHQIGNHTYNHLELPRYSSAEIRRQFELSEDRINDVAGRNPRPIWRPPYGEYNGTVLDIADAEGYPITVMWSIDTRDWDGPSAETIRQRIVQGAYPGAISLQHGFPPNTVEGTRRAVADLRARGYQFLTVTEILGMDRDQRDFGGETYVTQAGDSFGQIGRCHNITGPRVAAYNEVDDLAPGDIVRIPHTEEVIIRVGGQRQSFAVYPRLRDSRTMVHVRLAERLGASVEWNGTAAVVTTETMRMEIVPRERVALVNGEPVDMVAASFEENGRILVPARFLAERLGWRVSWTGDTYTADIDR
jgi:peptidoglycan/xylan/chitin deacetylase (PgdA/CDA1 family)